MSRSVTMPIPTPSHHGVYPAPTPAATGAVSPTYNNQYYPSTNHVDQASGYATGPPPQPHHPNPQSAYNVKIPPVNFFWRKPALYSANYTNYGPATSGDPSRISISLIWQFIDIKFL